jgi:hypothetical protein
VGDFQAYEGSHNFKYGGLIDKLMLRKVVLSLGKEPNESTTEFKGI